MGKIRDRILKLFPAGSFARNVATLMTGAVLAGTIGIIVVPLLTRLYKPEDFGLLAIYTSLLGVLTVVACWRYELAIVLPEKTEDAANLLLLCVIICLGMGFITFLMVVIFRSPLSELLGAPELAQWLWFLPLSVIAAGLFRLLNYWSIRQSHFKRLTARQITQSSVTAVAQIGAGILCTSANAGGLISGAIIGQLAATGRLGWQIQSDEGKFIRNSLSRSSFVRVFRRYNKFPLYDVWSAFSNTASTMLPAVLLSYFFTPAVAGFYALGYQVLAAPISVAGASIAQVFFPLANGAWRTGDLDKITLKMFERLLVVGFVPILLITIVAPDLFAVIFGAQWVTAGEYVRWISIWLLFVFISSPLSHIYSIMEKQREGLIVNIAMFSSRLIVLLIGGIKGDALFTIELFGVTGAVLWIFNCIYIQHLAGVSAGDILLAIIKQTLYGLPYAAIPILTYLGTQKSLAVVLAGMVAGISFLIMNIHRVKKAGGLI
jgi:lipopolysaccharide exporter